MNLIDRNKSAAARETCGECGQRIKAGSRLLQRSPEETLAFIDALCAMPDGGLDEDFERERPVFLGRPNVFD